MKNGMTKFWAALLTAGMLVGASACNTDDLLEVIDPDLVTPANVQGAKGAELFWAGALGQFGEAYSGSGGGMVAYTGMFSDEFHLSGTFPTRNEVDRREIDEQNGTMEGEYRQLHRARVAAINAAEKLEADLPGDSRIAELYNFQGYTLIFFGEFYCSGVPLGLTPNEGDVVQGTPQTTTQLFDAAITAFSSATAAAAGSTDQANLAAIGTARALLNKGDYAGAAAAVSGIATSWEYLIHHKDENFNQQNAIYELNQDQRRWSISDSEGGNGVAFRSANDPRVPWEDNGNIGFDEQTPLFEQLKYPNHDADVPLANGTEARLIEAEAELAAGQPGNFMSIINTLRTDAGMGTVADPGTAAGRVDLLFDERAFWLFGTAHRMGDLRRLVRQYGRSQDTVFPSGAYFKGGNYGTDVNFPIPFEESENPNVPVTQLCLDRSA